MTGTAVLVVEDEVLISLDITTALEEAGFEVVTASTGEQALTKFDAEPSHIKALLTDIRLGEGPTGWEVARHCRHANPGLPIIYMSGDSAPEWRTEGVPESVMIAKPFVNAQIIAALALLLNQAGQQLAETVAESPNADQ